MVEADVSDGDGWVTHVAFFQGSTLLSTVGGFPFRFTWTPSAAGGYSLTATATDNTGAQTTSQPISIAVNPLGGGPPPNQPPRVTLTSPSHNSTFPDGYPATIEADASDPEGALTGVEFFDGTASLGTATTAPYRIAWTATPPGSHSLRAVATDASGAATSSASVTVVVGAAPPPTVRPEGALQGVFFADESTGWVVGQQGRIYKSTDGGLTWTAQTSGTSAWLFRVQFVSTTTGWIVGEQGTILKTVNGGSTWTAQTSGTMGQLRALSFVSSSTGWAVGSNDILKTTNGGTTWSAQQHGSMAGSMYAVSFVNGMKGWVGAAGEVLSTSDGGATWSIQPVVSGSSGMPVYFLDARFISERKGAMLGMSREGGDIRTTTDGGATWVIHGTDAVKTFGLAFGDASHWWAVGEAGRILASVDGGATWAIQASPQLETLNAVWAISQKAAWAAGEHGTVIRTTDGGATWVLLTGGT